MQLHDHLPKAKGNAFVLISLGGFVSMLIMSVLAQSAASQDAVRADYSLGDKEPSAITQPAKQKPCHPAC